MNWRSQESPEPKQEAPYRLRVAQDIDQIDHLPPTASMGISKVLEGGHGLTEARAFAGRLQPCRERRPRAALVTILLSDAEEGAGSSPAAPTTQSPRQMRVFCDRLSPARPVGTLGIRLQSVVLLSALQAQ